MIGSAIAGALIGGTIPWVLKTAGKSLNSREGLILVIAYGAVAGFVLGVVL
ncbi:MAG: hypothetical protein AAGI03_15860 [Pseudomonadota bacterium]